MNNPIKTPHPHQFPAQKQFKSTLKTAPEHIPHTFNNNIQTHKSNLQKTYKQTYLINSDAQKTKSKKILKTNNLKPLQTSPHQRS